MTAKKQARPNQPDACSYENLYDVLGDRYFLSYNTNIVAWILPARKWAGY